MFNILFNFHGLSHNCCFHYGNNFLFLHYDLIHFHLVFLKFIYFTSMLQFPSFISSQSLPQHPISVSIPKSIPLPFLFRNGMISHEYQENMAYQNDAKPSTASLIKDGQGGPVRFRVPKASKTLETWAVSNSFLFLCLNYQIISMQQFS